MFTWTLNVQCLVMWRNLFLFYFSSFYFIRIIYIMLFEINVSPIFLKPIFIDLILCLTLFSAVFPLFCLLASIPQCTALTRWIMDQSGKQKALRLQWALTSYLWYICPVYFLTLSRTAWYRAAKNLLSRRKRSLSSYGTIEASVGQISLEVASYHLCSSKVARRLSANGICWGGFIVELERVHERNQAANGASLL